MLLTQVNAAVLQAAVSLAAAQQTHPTLQQVIDVYNLLMKVIDLEPPPRPRADPSQYTASAAGE